MRAGGGRAAALGGDFARLWTASAVSNLGDGVTGVAGAAATTLTLSLDAALLPPLQAEHREAERCSIDERAEQ